MIDANLATLVETGQVPAGVRPFRHKDGHIVEIESSVGRTVVGGQVLYCVVGRDPTERHEAERVRREAELRMRTFVDAAFEGLTITDKGRIVDANARLAEILRAPLDELVGRPVIDFVAPESRAAVTAHLASGAPQFYEHRLLRADGTVIPVEVRAKTIDVGDRTLRVTAIRDISERKSLEEQVRLAQRMESVGRLAGGVAHDFNNLLTVILSLVKFLRDRARSATDREDLEQIESAAHARRRADAAAAGVRAPADRRAEGLRPQRAGDQPRQDAAPGDRRGHRAGDDRDRRTWDASAPIPGASSRC